MTDWAGLLVIFTMAGRLDLPLCLLAPRVTDQLSHGRGPCDCTTGTLSVAKQSAVFFVS